MAVQNEEITCPSEIKWHLPPTPQFTQYPRELSYTQLRNPPYHYLRHNQRRGRCEFKRGEKPEQSKVAKSLGSRHRDSKSTIAQAVIPLPGAVLLKACIWGAGLTIKICKIQRDLQDGRGVRRGDHLPPHKYIRNTSVCGTTPTEHLLNAGRRLQTSQKARNSPRPE